MDQKLTIKNIADEIGVSTATVSRVLNGKKGYSEETKRRIEELINKTGYSPNPQAKALRKNFSNIVGIIVPTIRYEGYAMVASAIQRQLMERGFIVVICDAQNDASLCAKHVEMLRAQMACGLILVSISSLDEQHLKGIPVVSVGNRFLSGDLDQMRIEVLSDSFREGYMAAEELLSQGARHLLAVTSSLGRSSFEERFHGFSHRLKLFNDRETNKAEARLVTLEASETSLYSEVQDSFSKLFQDRYPFDGILFSNDSLAFPSINVILSHGYKIPADIKIVSRGNILIARHGQVRLTSICPDVQGISKCAADVLVRMMSGEEIENRTILFTSKLIPRESTRGKDEV